MLTLSLLACLARSPADTSGEKDSSADTAVDTGDTSDTGDTADTGDTSETTVTYGESIPFRVLDEGESWNIDGPDCVGWDCCVTINVNTFDDRESLAAFTQPESSGVAVPAFDEGVETVLFAAVSLCPQQTYDLFTDGLWRNGDRTILEMRLRVPYIAPDAYSRPYSIIAAPRDDYSDLEVVLTVETGYIPDTGG